MSFDITFKVACVLVNLLYESLLTLSNNLDVFSNLQKIIFPIPQVQFTIFLARMSYIFMHLFISSKEIRRAEKAS